MITCMNGLNNLKRNKMINGIISSFLLIMAIFLLTQEYYILGCLLYIAGLYVIEEETFKSE